MALYEYHCASCGTATEMRMPMADVLMSIDCPKCGKKATKRIGQFAVLGRAEEGFGDGAPPWDDDNGDGGGMDFGDDFGGHGHSHGPGGHTH
ncbi:MAG: FmdB family zinc ribbon protein [Dehalococcoidia bacterium]|nr:zinc ribbon domain-containing protein [Dehalococcoidia bacterium]